MLCCVVLCVCVVRVCVCCVCVRACVCVHVCVRACISNERFLYKVFPTAYVPVGCFQKNPNSLTEIMNLRSNIDYYNIQLTVEECAKLVAQTHPRYKVFGLLWYGLCYAGSDAEHTYKGMTKFEDCWSGVGKESTFFIYEFN